MLLMRSMMFAAFLFASLTIIPSDLIAADLVLSKPPQPLVDIHSIAPSIVIDMRYAGDHNFIGHPIPGYLAPRCLLTKPAAEALAAVQSDLAKFGLGLKVYDCYRPQRAVDFFVKWAKDPAAQHMKQEFYPRIDKAVLIREGYIASPSTHSRGSTTDLTIVPLPYSRQPHYTASRSLTACYAPVSERFDDGSLDMGTGFDCFDLTANTHAAGLTAQQRANRMLLATEMIQHGFAPYRYEWWHFTLKAEPYPDTFFDQAVN
jgi:zinc D-Ala-D-Ala dipeptidase